MPRTIRVLLLSDDPLVRTALRLLFDITTDFQLSGETANIVEIPHACQMTRPHILLLEGGGNRTLFCEVAQMVGEVSPHTRLVAIVRPATPLSPIEFSTLPLAGYCFAHEIDVSLLDLLRAVAAGATWVSGAAMRTLLTPPTAPTWLALATTDLTETEQTVATLLARGWSNAQITAEFNWTQQTTRNYVSQVYHKLGLSRSELIACFQQELKQS